MQTPADQAAAEYALLQLQSKSGVKRGAEAAADAGDASGGGVGRHATKKISDDGNMPTTTRAAASSGAAPSSAKKAKAAATSTSHVGKKLEFVETAASMP